MGPGILVARPHQSLGRLCLAIFFYFILLSAALDHHRVHAATCVFAGNGDWSDTAKWTPAPPSSTADDVLVGAGSILRVSKATQQVNSVSVSFGGSLSVLSGASLKTSLLSVDPASSLTCSGGDLYVQSGLSAGSLAWTFCNIRALSTSLPASFLQSGPATLALTAGSATIDTINMTFTSSVTWTSNPTFGFLSIVNALVIFTGPVNITSSATSTNFLAYFSGSGGIQFWGPSFFTSTACQGYLRVSGGVLSIYNIFIINSTQFSCPLPLYIQLSTLVNYGTLLVDSSTVASTRWLFTTQLYNSPNATLGTGRNTVIFDVSTSLPSSLYGILPVAESIISFLVVQPSSTLDICTNGFNVSAISLNSGTLSLLPCLGDPSIIPFFSGSVETAKSSYSCYRSVLALSLNGGSISLNSNLTSHLQPAVMSFNFGTVTWSGASSFSGSSFSFTSGTHKCASTTASCDVQFSTLALINLSGQIAMTDVRFIFAGTTRWQILTGNYFYLLSPLSEVIFVGATYINATTSVNSNAAVYANGAYGLTNNGSMYVTLPSATATFQTQARFINNGVMYISADGQATGLGSSYGVQLGSYPVYNNGFIFFNATANGNRPYGFFTIGNALISAPDSVISGNVSVVNLACYAACSIGGAFFGLANDWTGNNAPRWSSVPTLALTGFQAIAFAPSSMNFATVSIATSAAVSFLPCVNPPSGLDAYSCYYSIQTLLLSGGSPTLTLASNLTSAWQPRSLSIAAGTLLLNGSSHNFAPTALTVTGGKIQCVGSTLPCSVYIGDTATMPLTNIATLLDISLTFRGGLTFAPTGGYYIYLQSSLSSPPAPSEIILDSPSEFVTARTSSANDLIYTSGTAQLVILDSLTLRFTACPSAVGLSVPVINRGAILLRGVSGSCSSLSFLANGLFTSLGGTIYFDQATNNATAFSLISFSGGLYFDDSSILAANTTTVSIVASGNTVAFIDGAFGGTVFVPIKESFKSTSIGQLTLGVKNATLTPNTFKVTNLTANSGTVTPGLCSSLDYACYSSLASVLLWTATLYVNPSFASAAQAAFTVDGYGELIISDTVVFTKPFNLIRGRLSKNPLAASATLLATADSVLDLSTSSGVSTIDGVVLRYSGNVLFDCGTTGRYLSLNSVTAAIIFEASAKVRMTVTTLASSNALIYSSYPSTTLSNLGELNITFASCPSAVRFNGKVYNAGTINLAAASPACSTLAMAFSSGLDNDGVIQGASSATKPQLSSLDLGGLSAADSSRSFTAINITTLAFSTGTFYVGGAFTPLAVASFQASRPTVLNYTAPFPIATLFVGHDVSLGYCGQATETYTCYAGLSAIVQSSGTFTFTSSLSLVTQPPITLSGGVLTFLGRVNLYSPFVVTGGSIKGSTVANDTSVLSLRSPTGNAFTHLSSISLFNIVLQVFTQLSWDWRSTVTLYLSSATLNYPQIIIQPSAQVNVSISTTANYAGVYSYNGENSPIVNYGTVNMTVGCPGLIYFSAPFKNQGSVNIRSSTASCSSVALRFESGLYNNGSIATDSATIASYAPSSMYYYVNLAAGSVSGVFTALSLTSTVTAYPNRIGGQPATSIAALYVSVDTTLAPATFAVTNLTVAGSAAKVYFGPCNSSVLLDAPSTFATYAPSSFSCYGALAWVVVNSGQVYIDGNLTAPASSFNPSVAVSGSASAIYVLGQAQLRQAVYWQSSGSISASPSATSTPSITISGPAFLADSCTASSIKVVFTSTVALNPTTALSTFGFSSTSSVNFTSTSVVTLTSSPTAFTATFQSAYYPSNRVPVISEGTFRVILSNCATSFAINSLVNRGSLSVAFANSSCSPLSNVNFGVFLDNRDGRITISAPTDVLNIYSYSSTTSSVLLSNASAVGFYGSSTIGRGFYSGTFSSSTNSSWTVYEDTTFASLAAFTTQSITGSFGAVMSFGGCVEPTDSSCFASRVTLEANSGEIRFTQGGAPISWRGDVFLRSSALLSVSGDVSLLGSLLFTQGRIQGLLASNSLRVYESLTLPFVAVSSRILQNANLYIHSTASWTLATSDSLSIVASTSPSNIYIAAGAVLDIYQNGTDPILPLSMLSRSGSFDARIVNSGTVNFNLPAASGIRLRTDFFNNGTGTLGSGALVSMCGTGCSLCPTISNATSVACIANSNLTCTSCLAFCKSTELVFGSTCVSSCPDPYVTDFGYCNPSCTSGRVLLTASRVCALACPSKMYNASGVCTPCSTGCLSCSSGSACSQCNPDLYLSGGACVSSCSKSVAWQGVCIASCPVSPPTVLYNGVCYTQCPSGTYASAGSCAPSCPSGFYPNESNRTCDACSSACSVCFGPSSLECTSCAANLYLFGTSCQASCPGGYYRSVSGVCETSCGKGLLYELDACVATCSFGFYLQSANSTCVASCSPGVIFNTNCVSSCPAGTLLVNSTHCGLSCPPTAPYNSSSVCVTTCPLSSPYVFDGNCLASCPALIFNDTSCAASCPPGSVQLNATHCSSSCPFASVNGTCVSSCPDGYLLQNDTKVCVSTCPAGYYLYAAMCVSLCPPPTVGVSSGTCQAACPPTLFIDPRSRSCVVQCSLDFPWVDIDGLTCTAECSNGSYADTNVRVCGYTCPANTFRDPSSLLCVALCTVGYGYVDICVASCPTGTFVDLRMRRCVACDVACSNCTGAGSGLCIDCSAGYVRLNGTCLDTCPDGYYAHLGGCVSSCPVNAPNVYNGTCYSTCPSPLIAYNKSCIASCPVGMYANPINGCGFCDASCTVCYGASSSMCTECAPPFYQLNSTCLRTCPLGYFQLDGAKKECVTSCAPLFTDPDTSSCTSDCSTGLSENGVCVSSCSPGRYNFAEVCQPCNPACATCFAGAADSCYSCPATFVLYNGMCFADSCPAGTNRLNSTCYGECPGDAPWVFNATCVSHCPGNLVLSTLTCVSSCPIGFFNASGYCIPCAANCTSCTSFANCSSCASGRKLAVDQTACLDTCPVGTFEQYGACVAQCSAGLVVQGSQCVASCGALQLIDQGFCVSACPATKYANASSVCLPCNTSCASCSGPSLCSSCAPPLLLSNGVCAASCLDGLYLWNSTCRASCTPDTFALPQVGANTCVASCPNGYYVENRTCVAECSAGQGGDLNLNCIPCVGCPTCSQSAYNCTACSPGLILYNATCLGSCPANLFENPTPAGVVCVASCPELRKGSQCVSACSDTDVNDDSVCTDNCALGKVLLLGSRVCALQCPAGTFNSSGVCQPCAGGCAVCTSSSSCSQCQSSLLLHNGGCVSTCPAATYAAGNSSCLPCSSNCLVCNSTASCDACSSPHVLDANLCVATCSNGTFNQSGVCAACSASCSTCSALALCTSCPPGLVLYNSTCLGSCPVGLVSASGQCYTECPSALPFTRGSTCVSGCMDVEYFEQGACVSACSSDRALLAANRTCYPVCPTGYYNASGACAACSSGCQVCANASTCTSCISQLLLFNGACVNSCPTGFFSRNGACTANPCTSDLYWNNSTCVDDCGASFVLGQLCVAACPVYRADKVCVSACPPSAPIIASGGVCVSNCPSGQFFSGSSCVSQCPGLRDGFVCVSTCPNGKYALGGVCVTSCPTGTYISNGECASSCPVYISDNTCVSACNGSKPLLSGVRCVDQCASPAVQVGNACIVYCPKSTAAGIDWPASPLGTVLAYDCGFGLIGNVTRSCGTGGSWATPVLNCLDQVESLAVYARTINATNVNATLHSVILVLGTSFSITGPGVYSASSMLNFTLRLTIQRGSNIPIRLISIMSGLFGNPNISAAIDAVGFGVFNPGYLIGEIAYLLAYAQPGEAVVGDGVFAFELPNVVVVVRQVNIASINTSAVALTTPPGNFSTSENQVSVLFPSSLFFQFAQKYGRNTFYVQYSVFAEDSMFPARNQIVPGRNYLGAQIVSLSMQGVDLNFVDPSISFLFVHPPAPNNTVRSCVWYNYTSQFWSTKGCEGVAVSPVTTLCNCSHATDFSVLFSVSDAGSSEVLEAITYIGCSLSLAGALITFLTFLFFPALRTPATKLVMQLCVAIFGYNLVFMAGATPTGSTSTEACRAAGIFLHYFLLATFVWTLVIVFSLLRAIVFLDTNTHLYFKKFSAIAWGVPAVMVIITMAVDIDNYGGTNACWFNKRSALIGAFVVPALVIVGVNLTAFVFIVRAFRKNAKELKALGQEGRPQSRAILAIFVLLGVTWVFGVLALDDAQTAMQYLFVIFNSLQGLFVFVCYCCNSRVLKTYSTFAEKSYGSILRSTPQTGSTTATPGTASTGGSSTLGRGTGRTGAASSASASSSGSSVSDTTASTRAVSSAESAQFDFGSLPRLPGNGRTRISELFKGEMYQVPRFSSGYSIGSTPSVNDEMSEESRV